MSDGAHLFSAGISLPSWFRLSLGDPTIVWTSPGGRRAWDRRRDVACAEGREALGFATPVAAATWGFDPDGPGIGGLRQVGVVASPAEAPAPWRQATADDNGVAAVVTEVWTGWHWVSLSLEPVHRAPAAGPPPRLDPWGRPTAPWTPWHGAASMAAERWPADRRAGRPWRIYDDQPGTRTATFWDLVAWTLGAQPAPLRAATLASWMADLERQPDPYWVVPTGSGSFSLAFPFADASDLSAPTRMVLGATFCAAAGYPVRQLLRSRSKAVRLFGVRHLAATPSVRRDCPRAD